jgi:ABC-type sugar transport system permease subunit
MTGARIRSLIPYFFISPFFLLFALFGAFPIGYSIVMSLFNWKITGPAGFVGLQNYVNVLTVDPFFLVSIWNTVVLLVFGSLLQHLIALPLAILINSRIVRAKEFFKTTYFLPYVTSTVAVVIIFSNLFDTNFGVINWLIGKAGGEPVAWLGEAIGIKVALSTVLNWKYIGWNMVIYVAGLQAIPRDLYEAAEIDGAGGLRKHLSITLPQLSPVIFFSVSLSIIGGMQVFEEPYVMTGGYENMGGEGNSGLTAAFYLMFTAFKAGRFGKASAIAWILFLVILGLNWLNRRALDRLSGTGPRRRNGKD